MPRLISFKKTGRGSSYQKAMYRNLVTDLLGYEKITTTEGKAKRICILAEQMITLGKRGGLHSRRQVLSVIFDKDLAEKIFTEFAERYAQRPGGYTRIIKLGPRVGDGSPMVQLELVK
ncbi:MAG: 50S ribosomal protein L17 [Dehalococcoidales bacterium]|nr:50S ribosomal protein L17 [Dehalococcoidales bacterium]